LLFSGIDRLCCLADICCTRRAVWRSSCLHSWSMRFAKQRMLCLSHTSGLYLEVDRFRRHTWINRHSFNGSRLCWRGCSTELNCRTANNKSSIQIQATIAARAAPSSSSCRNGETTNYLLVISSLCCLIKRSQAYAHERLPQELKACVGERDLISPPLASLPDLPRSHLHPHIASVATCIQSRQ